jgi:large subunit ribosomal protein L24
MSTVKRIKKDDFVKIIAGAHKGVTGKVVRVLTKERSILVEGVNLLKRKVKPSQANPRGGMKDIHVPISLHKIALVVDEKSTKTSRVGLTRDSSGKLSRVARQNQNKEIK